MISSIPTRGNYQYAHPRLDPSRSRYLNDFHQGWTIEIRNALNRGVLPLGYVAATDQRGMAYEPDVSSHARGNWARVSGDRGGLVVAEAPPQIKRISRLETEAEAFARRSNRIVIRHARGRPVAVIEVVSPGNKDREHSVRRFAGKVRDFLKQGIGVMIVDLFPPGPHDRSGLHTTIAEDWLEIAEPNADDPPLAVVSYDAGEPLTSYLEPLAVGDALPDAPLFLDAGYYVPLPLETTYQSAWDNMGSDVREFFETGR